MSLLIVSAAKSEDLFRMHAGELSALSDDADTEAADPAAELV
jgi:hypothetical protein